MSLNHHMLPRRNSNVNALSYRFQYTLRPVSLPRADRCVRHADACADLPGRPLMKITEIVARYLLGLQFTVFGLNGFLNFIHQPPPTNPLALQFFGAISASHFA